MKLVLKRIFSPPHSILIVLLSLIHLGIHHEAFSRAFFWDDWSYMLQYKNILWGDSLVQNLFAPHNGHITPWIKLFYFGSFFFFGFSPFPLHLLVFFCNSLLVGVTYGLIWTISRKRWLAFFFASILAVTHTYDQAIYWIGSSHNLISASFFWMSLFLIQKPAQSPKEVLLFGICTFLCFSGFLMGIFMIPWIFFFLFYFKKKGSGFFLAGAVSSGLAVLPYFLNLRAFQTDLPGHLSVTNFRFHCIPESLKISSAFLLKNIVPEMFFPYLSVSFSLLILISVLLAGVFFIAPRGRVSFPTVFFFLMIFLLFIPMFGRINADLDQYSVNRYFCYPLPALLILLSLWFQENSKIKDVLKRGIVYCRIILIFCGFLGMIYLMLFRFPPPYPSSTLQKDFEKEIKTAVGRFLSQKPANYTLVIQNLNPETIFCFSWPNRNYFKIFLNRDQFQKLRFGERTDPDFLEFLFQNRYAMIYGIV